MHALLKAYRIEGEVCSSHSEHISAVQYGRAVDRYAVDR